MSNLSPTSTPTAVLIGVTNATVAAIPNREAVRFFNGGPNTVYLGYGTVAAATFGYPVPSLTTFVEQFYGGPITAITTGSAFLYVTDIPHG